MSDNPSYYARHAFPEELQDTETQAREASLGVWNQGNKRVRPNDYGLQDATTNAIPQYQTQQAGTVGHPAGVFPYIQTHLPGYTNVYPVYPQMPIAPPEGRAYIPPVATSLNNNAPNAQLSPSISYGIPSQNIPYQDVQHIYAYQPQQTPSYAPSDTRTPISAYGMPDHDWGDGSHYSHNVGWDSHHDSAGLYGKDASLHLKLQSLTVLDNLVCCF